MVIAAPIPALSSKGLMASRVFDRLAIVVNGEVVGVLMPLRPLTSDEFTIDASFFSSGTEEEKASDTRVLAQQIKSTLP